MTKKITKTAIAAANLPAGTPVVQISAPEPVITTRIRRKSKKINTGTYTKDAISQLAGVHTAGLLAERTKRRADIDNLIAEGRIVKRDGDLAYDAFVRDHEALAKRDYEAFQQLYVFAGQDAAAGLARQIAKLDDIIDGDPLRLRRWSRPFLTAAYTERGAVKRAIALLATLFPEEG